MRFALKALLAATALIPVATAATAQERGERWRGAAAGKIAERNEARGFEAPAPRAPVERPRMERPQAERAQPRWENRAQADAGAVNRPQRQWNGDGQRGWAGRGEDRRRSEASRPDLAERRDRADGGDRPRLDPGRGDGRRDWTARGQEQAGADRRDWNRDRQQQARRNGNSWGNGWNQPRRDDRWADRGGWNGRNDRGDRNAWNQPNRWNNVGAWNRTWRNDSRYDWNRYRTQNRYAYRLPRYYAPYGWDGGYRRFSIGVTLSDILWSENYWIEDPYAYRLPEVYGPYRWVRYYDDALLVDIRTGRVVDVVNDIFW